MGSNKRKSQSNIENQNNDTPKKRKVEVITFEDPELRRKSTAASLLMRHKQTTKSKSEPNDPLSLKAAAGDVYSLAVTGFDRKKKKIHENQFIKSLHGKVKSRPRVPFKIHLGMVAAAKKRDKRKRRSEKVAGVITNDGKLLKSNKKKHDRNSGGLAPIRKTKFRDGVMTVRGK